MPSFSTVEFLIAEAFSGINRNRLMSLAAVLTAAVSLAISAGFALTALAVHRACERLPQEFDMAVYMKRQVTAERLNEMKEKLRKMPDVASVTYISKEAGWKEFKRQLGEEIDTKDVVYNPALDTFKIKVKNPRVSKTVQQNISRMPDVDSVLWRQNEVAFFTGLSRVVGAAGAVATVVLFMGSAFIIGNTIRLGIYARRSEVAIMRLVGAKPSLIRLPFLMEGMLLAACGAVLAVHMIRFAGAYLGTLTLEISSITRFFDTGVGPWTLAAAMLAVGVALGAISSYLSVRRYLKEGSMEEART